MVRPWIFLNVIESYNRIFYHQQDIRSFVREVYENRSAVTTSVLVMRDFETLICSEITDSHLPLFTPYLLNLH
jgi:hypothetical protein